MPRSTFSPFTKVICAALGALCLLFMPAGPARGMDYIVDVSRIAPVDPVYNTLQELCEDHDGPVYGDSITFYNSDSTLTMEFRVDGGEGITLNAFGASQARPWVIEAFGPTRFLNVGGASTITWNSGLTFKGFSKASSGGAVHVNGDLNGDITSSFTSNTATSSGGAVFVNTNLNGNITGSFTSNIAANSGGAVYVGNNGMSGNITGSFTSNTAGGTGGAVHVGNSGISGAITNARFEGNHTSDNFGSGGAVYVGNSGMSGAIIDSTFLNNYTSGASAPGGAVLTNGGIGGIIGSTFTGNETRGADVPGGAVCVAVMNGNIDSSSFTNNQATSDGGAIHAGNLLAITNNSSFTGNQVTGVNAKGGAVCVIDDITGGITSSTFTGNTASSRGGAIFVGRAFGNGIVSSKFINNRTASGDGGAVYVISDITGGITNSTFTGNTAGNAGGAVIMFGSLVGGITGSTFTGNQAAGAAGGAVLVNGNLSGGITGSTFTGNTAARDSGALLVNGNLSGGITSSTFTGNTAGNGGALIVWGDLDNISAGSKFAGNSAQYFGGALFAGGNLTISHAEFIGNKATGDAASPASGRGGAIFHDARPWAGDPNKSLTLNAGANQSIVFSGNTMSPGAGAPVANSIYFGNGWFAAGGSDGTITATFNVAEGGVLHILDPLASQPDDMPIDAADVFSNLTLNINKTGPGAWVLAGLNDMQSATNWVVSAGSLHLVNDSSGAPAHINLANTSNKMGVANPASFTLKSGAALTLEPGNSPHQISGQAITLDSGSTVGLAHFQYGPLLNKGQYTALKLVGHNIINQSSVPVTSGTIAVGAFDYYYEKLAWSDNDLTFMVKDKPKPNPVRAGAGSITGTSAIGAFNPAFNAFNQHAVGLFNQQGIYNPYQSQAATQLSSGEAQSKYLNSLWVTPAYSYTNQNASNGNVGYDLKTPGFALGYDRQICDNAFVGLGASVSWPEYQGGGADINASDITFALYGGVKLPYAIELDGHVGYGFTRYDQDRQVQTERYSNKYNGNTMFVGLGLGRSFELGENTGFSVRPGVAYDFIHLNTDGFDEGAGVFALKTDDYSQDLHRVKAGLDVSWQHVETGFRATGQVYYLGLYGDREATASAHFVNDPVNGFTMIGNGPDENNLGLGLNVALPVTERWEFGAGYNVLVGSDTVSQQGMLNVTFKF